MKKLLFSLLTLPLFSYSQTGRDYPIMPPADTTYLYQLEVQDTFFFSTLPYMGNDRQGVAWGNIKDTLSQYTSTISGDSAYNINAYALNTVYLDPVAIDPPSVIRLSDGTLQRYYTFRTTGGHVNNSGKILRDYSYDNGKTWQDTSTVFDNPLYDDRNIEVSILNSGRISIFWREYNAPSTYVQILYSYSDDDGVTWATPTAITPTNINGTTEAYGYFFKVNSRWYKNVNNISSCQLFYSDDNGSTWNSGIFAWNYYPANTINAYEACFVSVGDTVIGIARTSLSFLRQFVSLDGAASFTAQDTSNLQGYNFAVSPRLTYDTLRNTIIATFTYRNIQSGNQVGYFDGWKTFEARPSEVYNNPRAWRLVSDTKRPSPKKASTYGYPVLTKLDNNLWLGQYTDQYLKKGSTSEVSTNYTSQFYTFYLTYGVRSDSAIISGTVNIEDKNYNYLTYPLPGFVYDSISKVNRNAGEGTIQITAPYNSDSTVLSIKSITYSDLHTLWNSGRVYFSGRTGWGISPYSSNYKHNWFITNGDTTMGNRAYWGATSGAGVYIGNNYYTSASFNPALGGILKDNARSMEIGVTTTAAPDVDTSKLIFYAERPGTTFPYNYKLFGWKDKNRATFLQDIRADGQHTFKTWTGNQTFRIDSTGRAMLGADALYTTLVGQMNVIGTTTSSPDGVLAIQRQGTNPSQVSFGTVAGTYAAPTALAHGAVLMRLSAFGSDGTLTSSRATLQESGRAEFTARGSWGAGNRGSVFSVEATSAGTTSRRTVATIGDSTFFAPKSSTGVFVINPGAPSTLIGTETFQVNGTSNLNGDIKTNPSNYSTPDSIATWQAGIIRTTAITSIFPSQTTLTGSGDGVSTAINITLPASSTFAMVGAANAAAAGITYWTVSGTTLTINYAVAPANGTNNLSYWISYK